MVRNKRILITGGGGFVGTSLAERLSRDNEVTLLDLNFDSNAYAFSDLRHDDRVRLVRADLLEAPEEVAKEVRNAEVVVHTAAMVGVQEVINNALRTLDVNYTGTSNILRALAGNPASERFIMFSTSEIFGSNAFKIAESGDSVLSSVQDVRWCYCISKLAAEHLAFSYFRQKGLPVVVVRPFNIFGPKRVGDHVVLRFILRALQHEEIEIYSDGTQIRAWCYIDDFCDALLTAMEAPEAVGQAFNIGNPSNTITVYALAKKIISLCNSRSRIVFKAPNFTDIDVRVPNATKAREILGFSPKVELDDGLTATIRWVEERIDVLNKLVGARERKYLV